MNLLTLLKSNNKRFYLFLGLLSLVSTITNLGILTLITQALKKNELMEGNLIIVGFFVLLILSFSISVYFQNRMSELTNQQIYDLELSIVKKIRAASFEDFQKVGAEKIFTSINESWKLGRLPEVLVSVVSSLIMVICGFSFLFWISPLSGLAITLLILTLFLINLARYKRIEKRFRRKVRFQERYYYSLYELINGFKQIKISEIRDSNLFKNHIEKNRGFQKALAIRCAQEESKMKLSGIYSWYVVLGAIFFVFPAIFSLNAVQLTSLVTAVFFSLTPATAVLNAIPFYFEAKVALRNLAEIDAALRPKGITQTPQENYRETFSSIRLENINHCFEKSFDRSFNLRISDLSINRGEVIFITGGNGTGKTTFLHILTGLLTPKDGKVLVNEREMTWTDYGTFSNAMSVIYSDHYLFSKNYDEHDFSSQNSKFKELTELLKLNDIFQYDHTSQQINTRLSKGQQKRVSLLLALLEDKPILILDEWPAEQDNLHKNLFYKKWLQDMKEMGKTVVLITHDREFHSYADRIICFD